MIERRKRKERGIEGEETDTKGRKRLLLVIQYSFCLNGIKGEEKRGRDIKESERKKTGREREKEIKKVKE